MTDELKPCPFCGGKAEMLGEDDGMYQVVCPNCAANIDNYDDEKEVAAKKWNKRKIEDAQAAEIKRMREALELIAKEKFYFARGEEEEQIRRVCEIAEEALKGGEE